MKVGYARVSTEEQVLHLQLDALQNAGCERVFEDHGVSGASVIKPGLEAALDFMRSGDTLVVWRLDRLGRDLRDLLDLSATLSSRKIELQSVMDKIDTSSAIGRLYFQMMESLAEFERAGGIERTKAGLAAARVRGVVMGRPSKIKPEQWIEAKALLSEGKAAPTVAKLLGITRQAIYRRLAIERGESTPPEQKPQFSAAPTRGGSHRNAPRETPA